MDTIDTFRDIRDKFESNYTIIVNNLTIEQIKKQLHKKLDHISTIKDNVRRKYLNDRVYSLIEHLNTFPEENVNTCIYLLGKTISIIPLSKQHASTLDQWSIPKFIFMNGEYFEIDYIKDLLFNNEYYDTIKINNKQLTHIQLNKIKQRKILDKDISNGFDLLDYISDNTKGKTLVHGQSSITKSLKPTDKILVFTKELSDDQIFKEYNKDLMLQVHQEVQDLI